MKYYLKNGVKNRVPYSDGVSIPFEPRSDGRGVLALDETKDENKPRIADLEKYIARKVGGVSAITAEQFEELKKNQHDPKPKADKAAPRVFSYKADPFATEASAPRVTAPGNVSPVAGASPAGSAVAPDSSEPDPKAAIVAQGPKSKGRPAVRTNKPKPVETTPAPAPEPEAPAVSAPAEQVDFVLEPEPSTPTPSAAGSNETTAPAE